MPETLWFDDVDELDKHTQTVDDLRAALEARREHWDECKTEMIFLGRIYGGGVRSNMVHLCNKVLPDGVAVPKVMEWRAFLALLAEHGISEADCWNTDQLTNESYQVPPSQVRCAVCEQSWTLENCTDAYMQFDFADIPLDDYAGKTLGEVEELLQTCRSEATYWLGRSFNDTVGVRHPGGTVAPVDGPDLRSPEERQDDLERWEEVDLSYVAKPGDMIRPFRHSFYHKACLQQVLQEREEATLAQYVEGLAQMCREVGFEEVAATQAAPPDYLLAELGEEFAGEDEEVNPEHVNQQVPYFIVKTSLGNLGFFRGGEGIPCFDLRSVGLKIADLRFLSDADQAPPDLSYLFLCDEELQGMREVNRVLLLRKVRSLEEKLIERLKE